VASDRAQWPWRRRPSSRRLERRIDEEVRHRQRRRYHEADSPTGEHLVMKWDLGLWGALYLFAMSLAFGVVAHVVAWRVTTKWLWAIATAGFFVLGLLISEGLFGAATEEDLQPNIDGLSRDEVLLALLPGVVAVSLARRWGRNRHGQHAVAAEEPRRRAR
jgi:hypothetical protein